LHFLSILSCLCSFENRILSFDDANILEALDKLEDYKCDRNTSENLYDRQQIEVFDLTEKSMGRAWAYFMTSEQVIKFEGVAQVNGYWN
jgi:gamma-glutamylcyclotransferase (GGCT)/AIG2-like uncharacterized protein YtfP